MSDRITLSSPGDVVAAIPALLGFQPHCSLVALWTDDTTGALGCTARLDLTTPEAEMTRRLLDLSARIGAASAVLVAYPATLLDWVDSTEEGQVLAVGEGLRTAGVELRDVLVVVDGRYYSMMCTDPECCPPLGRPVPTSTTVLEAERIGTGHLAVADSRDTVLARYGLRPDHIPARQALVDASYAIPTEARAACALALSHLATTTSAALDHDTSAQMMWLLQHVTVRDWVLAHLSFDPANRREVEVLVQLALIAPDELRPRLAGTAAAALAAAGDNPVGVWAMLEHAGEDSLARLVAASVEACAPPTMLREVFTEAAIEIAAQLTGDSDNAA